MADKPQVVMLVNVEDPEEIIHNRLISMTEQFGFDKDVLGENLHIVNGFSKIGSLMRLDRGNPVPTEQGMDFMEKAHELNPDLIILDTKARLYGLEENNKQ